MTTRFALALHVANLVVTNVRGPSASGERAGQALGRPARERHDRLERLGHV
ncbi:MAG TPA: hypothetical protein PLW10_09850 [Myxococcota bacterium]|nr:hypothetical protein [Myxococcota bacterium]